MGYFVASGELEDDRRLRGLLARAEERVAGHGDVEPRARHLADARNRPGDLALEGAAIVHVLEKLGLAECRPVEDLEADAPRAGEALRREVEPQPVHLGRRHANAATAGHELVVDLLRVEPGDYFGQRGLVHVLEEQRVGLAVHPERRADDEADDGHEGQDERDELTRRQRSAEASEAVEEVVEWEHGWGRASYGFTGSRVHGFAGSDQTGIRMTS